MPKPKKNDLFEKLTEKSIFQKVPNEDFSDQIQQHTLNKNSALQTAYIYSKKHQIFSPPQEPAIFGSKLESPLGTSTKQSSLKLSVSKITDAE